MSVYRTIGPLVCLGLMMLVHPIKTVILDVFGTGKTQIAVKMSGALRPKFCRGSAGKIFAGFALYSQKGLRKRKDSRLWGENSGGFANEKSLHGVGILAGICWTKSRVPAFPPRLKPLGQSKPNFLWSILRKRE